MCQTIYDAVQDASQNGRNPREEFPALFYEDTGYVNPEDESEENDDRERSSTIQAPGYAMPPSQAPSRKPESLYEIEGIPKTGGQSSGYAF